MSLFDMFSKSQPVLQSYRITEGNEERVLKRISSNDDTLDTSVLTEIMTSTFQSVNSLSTRLSINRERIQRSLTRLSRAGLISPVKY